MSVADIINEFEQAEEKGIAVRNLAQKYNVSQMQIIELLRKYNVKIPKILSRSEALELGDYGKENNSEKDIEFEKEVYPIVSINKRFEEMKWNEKDVPLMEKALALHSYIETTYGIDSFNIYVEIMINLVQNEGVLHLENTLRKIKSGKEETNQEKNIATIFLNMVEKIVDGLNDPEPETEPIGKPEERVDEKPLLVRYYEAYNMLKNPEVYKFEKWREKEKTKKKWMQKMSSELLKDVF